MNFNSWLIDTKINGLNVAVEMTIGEYAELANAILASNEFQRRRVKTSGRTYELLRRDLFDGCIMPPLILAVTEHYGGQIAAKILGIVNKGKLLKKDSDLLERHILQAINAKELIILDGLQRTHTIRQCIDEAESEQLESFLTLKIRAEIYIGLTKMGLLYRMMTLNTGQTPMSFRHQIEILYHDYIDNDNLPDRIQIFKEVDAERIDSIGKYKYQDVIDMFYGFTTGAPKSVDRESLVTQLRELDFLESYEGQRAEEQDNLQTLLRLYNLFVWTLNESAEGWEFTSEEGDRHVERPFGKSIYTIFSKVQPMSGFGAECQRLLKQKQIRSLNQLDKIINGCSFKQHNPEEALNDLIIILDQISSTAKKIGDAQRSYFQLCFRQLFNAESDSYQDLSSCWLAAQEQYETLF